MGIDRLASAAEVEKFLASTLNPLHSEHVGLFWKGKLLLKRLIFSTNSQTDLFDDRFPNAKCMFFWFQCVSWMFHKTFVNERYLQIPQIEWSQREDTIRV